jgi:hypothetical protein
MAALDEFGLAVAVDRAVARRTLNNFDAHKKNPLPVYIFILLPRSFDISKAGLTFYKQFEKR